MVRGGQKPKSAALKVVTGNPGRRPINEEPETLGEIGDPPKNWTGAQKALWWEVVNAAPVGVLTYSDRFLIELTVRNLAQVRSTPEMTAAQSAEMRRCLGEMGMTPCERARLAAPKGDSKNPFADL
jgi:hypothetical protein